MALWNPNQRIVSTPSRQTSYSDPSAGQAPTNQNLWDRYSSAADKSITDYQDILSGLKNYQPYQPGATSSITAPGAIAPITAAGADPGILSRYSQFADTGGFSGEDVSNIRARGVSPIRATYANAMQNLNRQRALQGGYSPNYTAATAKLTGGLAGQLADASTNVEAMLAPMIREGKLAGMSGLERLTEAASGRGMQAQQSNLQAELARLGMGQQAQQSNLQAELARQQMQQESQQSLLDAYKTASQLYGTRPGQAESAADVMQTGIAQGMERNRDVADQIFKTMNLAGKVPNQQMSGNFWKGGSFGGLGGGLRYPNQGGIFSGYNQPNYNQSDGQGSPSPINRQIYT